MHLRKTPDTAENPTTQEDTVTAFKEQEQEQEAGTPTTTTPEALITASDEPPASHHSSHHVDAEYMRATDSTLIFAEAAERAKVYIRSNCAPVLSIFNTAFLVSDGSYQSSNRALMGFTAISAAAYARGDTTVALASTSLAAYFAVSSTCQRGLSESVKAFVTSSTKLVTGACRLGFNFFSFIKQKVSPDQPAAENKMKRP